MRFLILTVVAAWPLVVTSVAIVAAGPWEQLAVVGAYAGAFAVVGVAVLVTTPV